MKYDFYQLTRKTQDAGLTNLLEKVMATGKKAILLCSNTEEVKRIDDLLWTYKEDVFFPHGTKGKDQPCLLTTQISIENEAEIAIFFNVLQYPLEIPERIERVLVFFNGEDDQILSEARNFYKNQKDSGVDLAFWQLKDNKWQKKG